MKGKLRVIAPLQKKGGCGKSATLGSLVAYMDNFLGMNPYIFDMDGQDSLFVEFEQNWTRHEQSFEEFDGFNGNRVLRRFSEQGFLSNSIDSPYPNTSITYFPFELFQTQESAAEVFHNAIKAELKKGDILLFCDISRTELAPRSIVPYVALADLGASYYFIPVSRPIEKEIRAGNQVYNYIKALMVQEGVEERRINSIPVINFAPLRNVWHNELERYWNNQVDAANQYLREKKDKALIEKPDIERRIQELESRLDLRTIERRLRRSRRRGDYEPPEDYKTLIKYRKKFRDLEPISQADDDELHVHVGNIVFSEQDNFEDEMAFNTRWGELPANAIDLPEVIRDVDSKCFYSPLLGLTHFTPTISLDVPPEQFIQLLTLPQGEEIRILYDGSKSLYEIPRYDHDARKYNPFGEEHRQLTSEAHYIQGIKQIAERILE